MHIKLSIWENFVEWWNCLTQLKYMTASASFLILTSTFSFPLCCWIYIHIFEWLLQDNICIFWRVSITSQRTGHPDWLLKTYLTLNASFFSGHRCCFSLDCHLCWHLSNCFSTAEMLPQLLILENGSKLH